MEGKEENKEEQAEADDSLSNRKGSNWNEEPKNEGNLVNNGMRNTIDCQWQEDDYHWNQEISKLIGKGESLEMDTAADNIFMQHSLVENS